MIKRRLEITALIMTAIMMLSGCSGSSSAQDLLTNDTKGETIIESEITETEKETAAVTENINKDMENMDAESVVKDIKFGFSVGNSLDATNDTLIRVEPPFKFETAWGNPKVTQELIDAMIDAGANVIRIPVSWKDHIADGPDYTIVESWMKRVKEVVDYAYDRGVYVILNLHHEDWNYPYYDNEEVACAEMSAIWGQIAETFKDYDEHLIFEGQNEPRKVGTKLEWNGGDKEGWDVVNATNKAFIDTIRSAGGSNPYRILMIPGYAANSTVGIKHLEVPEDDKRIVVSVHAYTPYSFALDTKGTDKWNDNTRDIDMLMDDLKTLFTDKGIPVIIGEFGAVNKDNESERAAWVTYYVSAAKEIGVPCIWWDNGAVNGDGENFGMIDRKTYDTLFPEVMSSIQNAIEQ